MFKNEVIICRQLKRRYVLAFFQKLPPCLVGIEACKYARFSALTDFEELLASRVDRDSAEPANRIARVLHEMVTEISKQFERNALNVEIIRLGLFADDDHM